jgi:hypothetical protein
MANHGRGPGWLAGVSGTTGFHGINSNIDVSVGQILRHINVIIRWAAKLEEGDLVSWVNFYT